MRKRATFLFDAGDAEETPFHWWLEAWKDKMHYLSGGYGCGCCVHMYDVEGPDEEIEAMPLGMRALKSEWEESGARRADSRYDIVAPR